MNLGELRALCADDLGRHDLVNEDYSDNGMNQKINAAMKVLDGLIPRPYNMKTKSISLTSGDEQFGVLDLRRPVYVYTLSSENKKSMYEFMPMDWFIRNQDILSSENLSTKAVYTFESTPVADDTDLGDGKLYIRISPAIPEDDTIYVSGDYFSNEMTADNDQNYWSEVHHQVCVWAVGYVLEVSQRNTEGANDGLNAIRKYLFTDRNFAADREYHDIAQMEG